MERTRALCRYGSAYTSSGRPNMRIGISLGGLLIVLLIVWLLFYR